MKSTVYKWRLPAELKKRLAAAARRRGTSISAILNAAILSWLAKTEEFAVDEKEQAELHARAEKFFGTLSGGDPHRSEKVREIVRERLLEKYRRSQRKP
jgi:predicted DNA-binding protein